MTRLSSRFDPERALIGIACLVLLSSVSAAAAGLLGYVQVEYGAIGLSMAGGVLLLFALAKRDSAHKTTDSTELHVIGKIAGVCTEITKGNFEARITKITESGPLAEAQHRVNDMIDRCDAFIREATASLEAVCRNVYYRRIMLGGMQGSFRVAAEIINNAVKAQERAVEKARQEAAAEQARLIGLLAEAHKKWQREI